MLLESRREHADNSLTSMKYITFSKLKILDLNDSQISQFDFHKQKLDYDRFLLTCAF